MREGDCGRAGCVGDAVAVAVGVGGVHGCGVVWWWFGGAWMDGWESLRWRVVDVLYGDGLWGCF